jgi:hypothetical protein
MVVTAARRELRPEESQLMLLILLARPGDDAMLASQNHMECKRDGLARNTELEITFVVSFSEIKILKGF